jgi:hypothetical protein
MSFRSSEPVRLRDQHPETGSIPGSSTEYYQFSVGKSLLLSRSITWRCVSEREIEHHLLIVVMER